MAHDWTPRGYTRDRLLGRGGSAQVWRAVSTATGDVVALKRISLEVDEPLRCERVRRAEAEIQLLGELDHPGIVGLRGVARTRRQVVLVLDLAERGSLRDLLAVRGRLTPGELITALGPVGEAVAHLHARDIVHGDVSAANVLFTAAGGAKLSDVGQARAVGDTREVESTPIYVDPAVASGMSPVPASDVFNLGALAFHALTGDPLWVPGPVPVATLARAVGGVPHDIAHRLVTVGVPAPMVEALMGALVDDPRARCTATELVGRLRASAAAAPVEFGAGRPAAVNGAALAVARVRPQIPRPQARSRPGGRPSGGRANGALSGRHRSVAGRARRGPFARWAGVAVLVTLVATIGVSAAAASSDRPSASPSGSTAPVAAPDVPRPSARVRTAAPSTSVVRLPSRSDVSGWSAALARLDAMRAAAYADRRPELLRAVYVPGPLLVADAIRLRVSVPSGCGLRDVRTSFRVLSVTGPVVGSQGTRRAALLVTARVAPSNLVCAGAGSVPVPGTSTSRMRVDIEATSAGPRIVAEHPA